MSIIIPSYNRDKFIERAILSVLNQTYSNIELVVIDGGSTDNTVSILHKYDDKIRWVSEPDREAHALNKGTKMARGEILNFLSSDDTLRPRAIELAVKTFLENPNAGMVFGDQNIIDEEDKLIGYKETEELNLYNLLNRKPDIVAQESTFIRRIVFDRVGLWNNVFYCADLDLWIRILSHFEAVHIPEPLSNSRRHAEQQTAKTFLRNLWETFRVCQKYGGKIFSEATFRLVKAGIWWLLRMYPKRVIRGV